MKSNCGYVYVLQSQLSSNSIENSKNLVENRTTTHKLWTRGDTVSVIYILQSKEWNECTVHAQFWEILSFENS